MFERLMAALRGERTKPDVVNSCSWIDGLGSSRTIDVRMGDSGKYGVSDSRINGMTGFIDTLGYDGSVYRATHKYRGRGERFEELVINREDALTAVNGLIDLLPGDGIIVQGVRQQLLGIQATHQEA